MIQNSYLYLCSDEKNLFDVAYRYKVPLPKITKEMKKGTMITKIEDYKKFCKSIEIKEEIFVKSIASKFSCPYGIEKGQDYCFWKGDYLQQEVMDAICFFIHSFFLCSQCDKPEVLFSKPKKKNLIRTCKACGFTEVVPCTSKNQKMYEILSKSITDSIG